MFFLCGVIYLYIWSVNSNLIMGPYIISLGRVIFVAAVASTLLESAADGHVHGLIKLRRHRSIVIHVDVRDLVGGLTRHLQLSSGVVKVHLLELPSEHLTSTNFNACFDLPVELELVSLSPLSSLSVELSMVGSLT